MVTMVRFPRGCKLYERGSTVAGIPIDEEEAKPKEEPKLDCQEVHGVVTVITSHVQNTDLGVILIECPSGLSSLMALWAFTNQPPPMLKDLDIWDFLLWQF